MLESGRLFVVDKCQQNKDLEKDLIRPCLLHGERDNVLAYLPEKSWLRIGLSFLWTKASKTQKVHTVLCGYLIWLITPGSGFFAQRKKNRTTTPSFPIGFKLNSMKLQFS